MNYRPVANLCSVSKIFEKLILKKINELEIVNRVSVGGKQQHGFLKNKSTVTAGLILQSLIACALDDDYKPWIIHSFLVDPGLKPIVSYSNVINLHHV